jgi:dihydrofolate reductase
MARIVSSATMSLDGFIAYEDDSVGALFDWFEAGDVEIPTATEGFALHLTPPSAEYWGRWTRSLGALVVGRRLFDVTSGWGGRHPLGVPVVVLTHRPPEDWSPPGAEDFTFVTTGVEDAVRRAAEIAGNGAVGDGVVGVAAGVVATQALAAGLLDSVAIDLAPVILGRGKPYFTDPDLATAVLSDPVEVVVAPRVTHLLYDVPRA